MLCAGSSGTHQIAPEVHVLGVALAPPAEEVRRAGADAAHVGAVARALHRVLDVALRRGTYCHATFISSIRAYCQGEVNGLVP